MTRRPRTPVVSPIMSLQAHLKEARNRLLVVLVVFAFFSILAYMEYDRILYVLLLPLHGQKLMYLNPAGGLSFIMTATLWAGFAATLPLLLYNLYQFIAPSLPVRARTRGGLILVASTGLFCLGVLFGYCFAIPGALHFLTNFGSQYVQAMITADAYLRFTLMYTVGLGLLFQVPILMLLVHWVTPLKPGGLLKAEPYVLLIAFIAGAILSPSPDALNQTLIATPLVLMYQIGLVAIVISRARTRRQAAGERVAPVSVPVPRPARSAAVMPSQVIARVAAPATPVNTPSQPRVRRQVDGFAPARRGSVAVPVREVPRPARPLPRRQSMDVFVERSARP